MSITIEALEEFFSNHTIPKEMDIQNNTIRL